MIWQLWQLPYATSPLDCSLSLNPEKWAIRATANLIKHYLPVQYLVHFDYRLQTHPQWLCTCTSIFGHGLHPLTDVHPSSSFLILKTRNPTFSFTRQFVTYLYINFSTRGLQRNWLQRNRYFIVQATAGPGELALDLSSLGEFLTYLLQNPISGTVGASILTFLDFPSFSYVCFCQGIPKEVHRDPRLWLSGRPLALMNCKETSFRCTQTLIGR